jgi:hypothetical protein
MQRAWAALVAAVVWTSAAEAGSLEAATAAWGALLGKYVKADGGVDYVGLGKDQAALDAVLTPYATLDLSGASDAAKKAALINFYNAGMMHNLLRHAREEKLDVASGKFLALEVVAISVPGGNIWNGSYKLKLSGVDVTLDDVEHGLIRGAAKIDGKLQGLKVQKLDARIHAAVNCAALSCPRVREQPYTEALVDRMLDENMREFVSTEAQFSKVDDDTLRANKIVSWYYDDFEAQGGAGNFLAGFLADKAKDKDWKAKHLKENLNDRNSTMLKLSRAFAFHYDWRVNDVRNKP